MLNENNSKGLCRIPAFLDNLETQLECLAFSDPKLQLPTEIGTESKAVPEGRGRPERSYREKLKAGGQIVANLS